ncbi:MAG: dTMP kinase [Promethearchaeota archaeon]
MEKGFLIAFIGVDGSGKTTQAKLLFERLKQDGLQVSYVWSRWDPIFLRPLINIWKKTIKRDMTKSNYEVSQMKNTKKRLLNNFVFRWLWLVCFLVDYGVQMFIKMRIELFRRKVIISDRTFYDSLIDQAINLGNKKSLLLDNVNIFFMNIFFPQPDLIIYLDCPVDIAFFRKVDVPDIEYIKERKELYLKLASKYGWTKVDGALDIDDISAQVRDKVYSKLGI